MTDELPIEARPQTLLEHLDRANEGRMAVQHLADTLMSGTSWQFIHKKIRVDEYHVDHERDGCDLCDQIDVIWRIVGDYRTLVRGFFAEAQEAAERVAREQARREYAEQITRETTAYLLSRPEFTA